MGDGVKIMTQFQMEELIVFSPLAVSGLSCSM